MLAEKNNYFIKKSLTDSKLLNGTVYSTLNMVTWTEHPIPFIAIVACSTDFNFRGAVSCILVYRNCFGWKAFTEQCVLTVLLLTFSQWTWTSTCIRGEHHNKGFSIESISSTGFTSIIILEAFCNGHCLTSDENKSVIIHLIWTVHTQYYMKYELNVTCK